MDKKIMNPGAILRGLARNAVVVSVVVAAFAVGFWLKPGGVELPSTNQATDEHAGHGGMGTSAEHGQDAATIWTCAMHPQIQQDEPGLCPLCSMNLIPVADHAGSDESNPRTFVTSEAARAMMQIQTSPVERRFAEAEIRMAGKIEYDETKLGYITAWVPGRIDEMFVDFTGIKVKKGDHLVSLYSPEILMAQSELRRAIQAVARLKADAPKIVQQTAKSTLVATQEKLRRWGLTDEQIKRAEKEGISSDHITIYAPMGGTVIDRNGQEGMYVDVGSRIYTIADLSQVWVMLDAYESDLGWLHYG
ncbi:MAG: efflux RND transporter periplasmic adaptor subunit, partial [Candidatus Hydrogenedentes bacterium]|nr:efflux RND transporter periplasmic adaptor subunit [Candidatus Hydrogenedentota bacterium]